jgi:hypothetical protein
MNEADEAAKLGTASQLHVRQPKIINKRRVEWIQGSQNNH